MGWLKTDARPLDVTLDPQIAKVESFGDETGELIYHIVYLQPCGFVIVAADDLVEPIIGFADDGIYDPSPANPLGALVNNDLKGRVAAARALERQKVRLEDTAFTRHHKKWERFANFAQTSEGELSLMGLSSLSDVRVAPLVQSKWSQGSVCGSTCYNYYTPDNYYCGCVATTMAQLMWYHRYPVNGIGVQEFWVRKNDGEWFAAYTRGGDASGGPYKWNNMVDVPNCSTTLAQREAIGAICYDAAISVNTNFTSTGSDADTHKAKDTLINTFQYGNAVKSYNSGANIGAGLIAMINPNLDAKDPVIISIKGLTAHAVICDGYGYNFSTLYHHLNMGWGGLSDAWYNLPDINSEPAYSSVYKCVYNIHITGEGDGEIISGRILDHTGSSIANADVYAKPRGSNIWISATSDDKGIYAFDSLSSNTIYTITVETAGYIFPVQNVTTGISRDNFATCGNVWGVDFYEDVVSKSDLNYDFVVDLADFAIFTSAWLAKPEDANWNPDCDISIPADNFIDELDLTVFLQDWLTGGQ